MDASLVTGHLLSWPPYATWRILVGSPMGLPETTVETQLIGAGWTLMDSTVDDKQEYRVWGIAGGGEGGEWLPHEHDRLLLKANDLLRDAEISEEYLDDRKATDSWLALLSGLPRGDSWAEHGAGFWTVVGDFPSEAEPPVTVRLLRPLLLTGGIKTQDGTYVEMHWVVPEGTSGIACGLHWEVRVSFNGVDDIEGLRADDLVRDGSEFYGPHAWFVVCDGDEERVPPDHYCVQCVVGGVVQDSYSKLWDASEAENTFEEWVREAAESTCAVEIMLCRLSRPPLTRFVPPQDPTIRTLICSVVVGSGDAETDTVRTQVE